MEEIEIEIRKEGEGTMKSGPGKEGGGGCIGMRSTYQNIAQLDKSRDRARQL